MSASISWRRNRSIAGSSADPHAREVRASHRSVHAALELVAVGGCGAVEREFATHRGHLHLIRGALAPDLEILEALLAALSVQLTCAVFVDRQRRRLRAHRGGNRQLPF